MATSYFDKSAATWDDEPRRIELMRAIGDGVVRQVEPTRDMDVLDYGCGTGLVGLYLLPYVRRVTGADNSPGMLEVLRKKIAAGGIEGMTAVQLDLVRDPVPSERYQMIVVGMAMHHIANPRRVLEAFYQLLEPGGALCLADLDTEPGTFHPPDVTDSVHHHGFDREQLKSQLVEIGFTEPRDITLTSIRKPVAGGGEADFSIFLITARRGTPA